MRKGLAFADRTAVLFLGVAAGAAIGYAFAAGAERPPPAPAVPPTRLPPPLGVARGAAAAPDVAPECALPFQSHLLRAVAAGDAVTVGIFGDSFGDGVWSALYRLLPASEKFRVLKYSQQSTGFTRYASLDLEEHASKQIAADGPVDVAVISFGANDTQGVYADGRAAPLMSPAWQRVVGGRIERFVALMRARGAIVYWVGLPKMRATRFDADIAAMNAFYERRMRALRVPFIDVKPLTVDPAGDYAAYLPDPASREMRLMRANDGVHMSMNGYIVITRALAARIKAYVAAARTMVAGGDAATSMPLPPPPEKISEPRRGPDAAKPPGEKAPAKPAEPKPAAIEPVVPAAGETANEAAPSPRPPLRLQLPPSDAPVEPDTP